jgi:hypothetical protein
MFDFVTLKAILKWLGASEEEMGEGCGFISVKISVTTKENFSGLSKLYFYW